jgi:hypothetical protein
VAISWYLHLSTRLKLPRYWQSRYVALGRDRDVQKPFFKWGVSW